MAQPNDIAATLMEHLCNHDWHGYDQTRRWGDGEGYCPVEIDGRVYNLFQGDRDCSSAVSECWQRALEGTPYAGKLDGATYTGNMRSAFLASGLFEWKPMSFTAQRGDVYLNEGNHTAMCVSVVPDMLAEFSLNEKDGITGGQVGDQTGRESSIHAYYDYPWDGILHYVGPGNVTVDASSIEQPRYRVATRDGWLPWMEGLHDTGGSTDDYAGQVGKPIYDAEIDLSTLGRNGWYQLTIEGGIELPRNTQNTAREKPLIGITIYYDTPEPAKTGYYVARYHVSPVGGAYYKWEIDDQDDGAGGEAVIDRLQLVVAPE